MCYSGSPGIIDGCELLAIAHAGKKKGARSEQDNRTRFAEYKQTHTHTQMITRVQMNVNLPCRRSVCIASDDIYAVLSPMYAEHTHTHSLTPTQVLFSCSPVACDWQIDWPAHCSVVCFFWGETWQVEIGKIGSPLFSPLGWTKDQTFFSPLRK